MISELELSPTVESPDYYQQQAANIVGSLGSTYRDFGHACEQYNSEFFRDEPVEFCRALAQALTQHFQGQGMTNPFWIKLGQA